MTSIVRDTRLAQGLTQAQLAKRLGVSQPSVARIEAAGDAITLATLRRSLNAMGRGLVVQAVEAKPSHDITLLIENLKLTEAQRMAQFDRFYRFAQEAREAGVTARATP